jgi:hypothetical protein
MSEGGAENTLKRFGGAEAPPSTRRSLSPALHVWSMATLKRGVRAVTDTWRAGL